MKVAWLTARCFGSDLCDTTQSELAKGLAKKGIELTVYSPGELLSEDFNHVSIKRSRIKGLQTISVIRGITNHLSNINTMDCVLVDWKLSRILSKLTPRWVLIDRGPPADNNLMSKFQWRSWKRGWKMAEKGCVVSAQHQQFVEDRVEQQGRKITVLPACVDTSLFNILERRGPIRLVYHGRMDRHRGIDTVLRLFKSLENKNGEFELYLHGKGPMYEKIRSQAIDNVTVTGRLERAEVAKRLATYDIGLLPMPPRTIWKLASPLKRAEYLGSGLCVLGIDHEGHRLPDRSPATFMKLYPQSEFLEQAQAWLSGLKRQALTKEQRESRKYAEQRLQWSQSVDALFEIIRE